MAQTSWKSHAQPLLLTKITPMNLEPKFYVYEHIRPDTGAVFYVGKGCGRRAIISSKRSQHWQNVVNKAGGRDVRYLAENLPEELAFLCEQEAIDQYQRIGVKLINRTGGGEGSSGFMHTEQTRQKMSESRMGEKNPTFGTKRPVEMKLIISQKMKGRFVGRNSYWYGKTRSEEVKRKISEALKGRRMTDEQKKRHSEGLKRRHERDGNKKPVLCVTTNVVFKSVSDAASALQLIRQSIRDVCNGKLRTTGGYKFEWSKK
jgi:group I intron endonuclease